MVAAIAAEAIGRLSATDVATTKLLPSFYAKIAARLRAGAEPEAMLSFISALCGAPGTPAPPAAFDPVRAEAVRAAVDHPSAVVRQAARTCLTERTGEDPGPGAPTRAAPATPADPTALLGRRVTWTVTTTRGDLRISLDPDTAPWNVATLTTLAQRGAFDGTLWHRVVADFVVQGGDPTGSGWGGPGFTVPAEPSLAPYDRGAIGIADAGRDTGGSQWFIMHSTAPHLEQRYTWIGHVLAGQDVVDRLLVGDRIVRVQVQIDDAPLDAAPNPSPVDRP
jgi:cyclophilin family peptidyl-prolyl cis-trans isomerase